MVKTSQEQTVKEFASVEGYQQELEKQVKQKQWEIEDIKAMNNVRLAYSTVYKALQVVIWVHIGYIYHRMGKNVNSTFLAC